MRWISIPFLFAVILKSYRDVAEKTKPRSMATIIRLLCIFVTGLGLYYALAKIDFKNLGQAFSRLRIGWFAGGVALFGFACVIAGWRLHLMVRLTRVVVHFQATLRTVLVGHFFYTVFLGAAGGDLAKTAVYTRWFRMPLPEVLVAFSLDRLLGLAGLLVFALMGVGLASANGAFARVGATELRIPPWMLVALTAAAIAALFVVWRWRPKGNSIFVRTWNSLTESGQRLLSSPRLAGSGLLSGVIVQAALSSVFAVNLRAVASVPIHWEEIFWVFPLLFALSALPISVGGLGVRETAALGLLGMFGIPPADAVAASLLTFATGLIWMLTGAIIFAREETLQARPLELARKISVVIPTLNEAQSLPSVVEHLRKVPEVSEIIVVDGGSSDGTARLAEALGCKVLVSPASRGGQLRTGAVAATEDVILLLHADTWLPAHAGSAIVNALRDSRVVAGAFWKIFRDPPFLLKGSRWKCALRFYLGGRFAADQGIFVRRASLEKIGGIPDQPLMEEFELCRRMRKIGRLALADATVETSARRFAARGIVRTYTRMWRVTLQYYLGTPPAELKRLYEVE